MKVAVYAIPILVVISLFLNRSCAPVVVGAAAGAGTVAYIQGELKTTDEVPLERAWIASQAAMDSMQFRVVEREKDVVDARLKAIGAADKEIYINLHSVSPQMTEVRIRIGVFGDQDLSRRILNEIRERY
jgi:hypothetical protein